MFCCTKLIEFELIRIDDSLLQAATTDQQPHALHECTRPHITADKRMQVENRNLFIVAVGACRKR